MPRARDRASANGLLPMMEARPWADGKTITYRLKVRGGKPINLGTDRAAAIRQVLDMGQRTPGFGTLRWTWDRYKESTRWQRLAEGTRKDYEGAWKQIEAVFGHMLTRDITPAMVARYVHVERAKTPRRADIEKALMSRIFGHGIKLGVCERNPTVDVEPHGQEARTEAPPPELLARFLSWLAKQTPQRRVIGMAAEFASLEGSRKVEFLTLTWPQVDRAGGQIRLFRAKQRGGKRGQVVDAVRIGPQLDALLKRLEGLREDRPTECLWVFPTRSGTAYTASGFKAMWQKVMLAAIEDGVLAKAQRFTFHDLRAYYTTVHKAERGALPDLHANPETTARVYDRTKVVGRDSL